MNPLGGRKRKASQDLTKGASVFRSIGMLAATGIAGLVALKLLGYILLPILGMALGLVMTVLKILFIVGLIWFGWHLFQRWTHGERGSEA